MKICLVLEGSYPYVRGGVSTWVDSYIRALPGHEFILWTINDIEDKRGKFGYDIPPNVTQIYENFLSSALDIRVKKNPELKLSLKEREAFTELIKRRNPDWKVLLNSFSSQLNRPVEFFLSSEFLEMLKELSRE